MRKGGLFRGVSYDPALLEAIGFSCAMRCKDSDGGYSMGHADAGEVEPALEQGPVYVLSRIRQRRRIRCASYYWISLWK